MKSWLLAIFSTAGFSMCAKVSIEIGEPQTISCSPERDKWRGYGILMFVKRGGNDTIVAKCEYLDAAGNGTGHVQEPYKNRWNLTCSKHSLHLHFISIEDDLGYYVCKSINEAEYRVPVVLVKSESALSDNRSSSLESTSTDHPSSNLQAASTVNSDHPYKVPLIIVTCLLFIMIIGAGIVFRTNLKRYFQHRFGKKKQKFESEPIKDEEMKLKTVSTENGVA